MEINMKKSIITLLALKSFSAFAGPNPGVICLANLSQDPFDRKGLINEHSQCIGNVSAKLDTVSFNAFFEQNGEVTNLKILDSSDGRTLMVDRLIVPDAGYTTLKLLLKNGNYAEVQCQKF